MTAKNLLLIIMTHRTITPPPNPTAFNNVIHPFRDLPSYQTVLKIQFLGLDRRK